MTTDETLLLGQRELVELLSLNDCIDAVEKVFRRHGEGKLAPGSILGLRSENGGLHVKAAILPGEKSYFVAKLNTNFPGNAQRFGRATIQGLIVLNDAETGTPLAVLDSMEITVKRTAAASAVAAKYLARKNSNIAIICGCGFQGQAQLRALNSILPLQKVYAFDQNEETVRRFALELSPELKTKIESVRDLPLALGQSDICVTCTPSRQFFIEKKDVSPGTFIAAVGADDAHKQEIDPQLMASARVVADSLEQCCAIGDTHHAVAAGLMKKEDVCAELSEIVAGRKPGRSSDSEIIIFDSTGVAMEDAAAAVIAYERAIAANVGRYFRFAA